MDCPILTLEALEAVTSLSALVCTLRIRLLEDNRPGLPYLFLNIIQQESIAWMSLIQSKPQKGHVSGSLVGNGTTGRIRRLLSVCLSFCLMDATLSEELGREGLHVILTKIMRVDPTAIFPAEEDQDAIIEIQDLAGEIASIASGFPIRISPFPKRDLLDRLPLMFPISSVEGVKRDNDDDALTDKISILINQVQIRQTSQADVGFIMWPSAVVLARFLATNPSELQEKEVLEIGAGCGLAGLVASRIKQLQQKHGLSDQTKVILTDFNPVVIQNCKQNIELNGLSDIADANELDFYKQDVAKCGWLDGRGVLQKDVDLILAADVICQVEDAYATARTIYSALSPTGKAIVVSADSQHRFGVEKFVEACKEINMNVASQSISEMYEGRLLNLNMEKTTGYVQDMSLTMYIVTKELS